MAQCASEDYGKHGCTAFEVRSQVYRVYSLKSWEWTKMVGSREVARLKYRLFIFILNDYKRR